MVASVFLLLVGSFFIVLCVCLAARCLFLGASNGLFQYWLKIVFLLLFSTMRRVETSEVLVQMVFTFRWCQIILWIDFAISQTKCFFCVLCHWDARTAKSLTF